MRNIFTEVVFSKVDTDNNFCRNPFSKVDTIVNIFSFVLLLLGYVLIVFALQDKKNASKYVIASVVLFLGRL
jgi:hypothetical protein